MRDEDFEKLSDQTPPEMRRSDLCSTILFLKALGIDNILRYDALTFCHFASFDRGFVNFRFDFPSPPPAKNMLASLETLFALDMFYKSLKAQL